MASACACVVGRTTRLPFLRTPYILDFGAEISAPAGQNDIPLVRMERASGATERAAMCVQHFNVFGALGGKAGGIALKHRHEDPTGLPITSVGSALKVVMYQVLTLFLAWLCPG
jgi:hypothetical protein